MARWLSLRAVAAYQGMAVLKPPIYAACSLTVGYGRVLLIACASSSLFWLFYHGTQRAKPCLRIATLSACSFRAVSEVGARSGTVAPSHCPLCANSASSWQRKPPCLYPAVPECCRSRARKVCVAWWWGLLSSLHYPPCISLHHYATVAHLARPGASSHRHGRGRGRAVRARQAMETWHARHTFLTPHRTALR